MQFLKEKKDNYLFYSLSGKLDSNTCSEFETDILEAVKNGERFILVDFEKLDYISSAGLRIFLVAVKLLKNVEGRIVLCSMNKITKDIFTISGFNSIFSIFDTRQEAEKEFL